MAVLAVNIFDFFLLKNLHFFDNINNSLFDIYRQENPHKKILTLLKFGVCIFLFFITIYLIKSKNYKILYEYYEYDFNRIIYSVGIIAFITYISIFSVLIFNDKYILNDFIQVPQRTIISIDGKSVDDIQVLNNNFLPIRIIDHRDNNDKNKKIDGKDKKLFELNNSVDPRIADLRGYYFYHHAYNYGPIAQIHLHAPIDRIVMIYGYVAALVQQKVLGIFGEVNFQNYLNLFYFEYILYYLLYIILIQLIFKDERLTSIAAILYTSTILLLGLELIKLAPGFNPIRHLFDIIIFYFAYKYFKHKIGVYLLLTITLTLFSLVWSKDFGIYICASFFLTLIYFNFSSSNAIKNNAVKFFIIASYFILVAVTLFYPMPGSNPSSIYFLIGLGAPAMENKHLITWCMIFLAPIALTFLVKVENEYKFLTVFACFYSLSTFSYFIWYPKAHHITGVGSIYIFWILCLVNNLIEKKKIFITLSLLTIILFIYSMTIYLKGARSYDNNFKNHIIYNFDVNGNKFKSIGDPSYYQNSLDIINKHSNEEPDIHIISKYDYILSILSGKYLNTGYIEIWSNLVSDLEVNKIVDLIERQKPKYLYVDVDIVNFANDSRANKAEASQILNRMRGNGVGRDIIYEDSPLMQIYNNIKLQYYICEKGLMIDVLCLKK